AEPVGRVRAGCGTGLADLLQEFTVWREFKDLVVVLVVAGEPDIAVFVDENAVLILWPVETFARSAPGSEQIAGLVEFEHRRGCSAALGRRRVLLRALLVIKQRRGAVNDPDIVAAVDRDAGDLAENPIAWQRFGPERLRFETRRVLRGDGFRVCSKR